MSAATEDHGHGVPDELIVVGFAGLMTVLIVAAVGLAFLARMWNEDAEPNRRIDEPPPVVEVHH